MEQDLAMFFASPPERAAPETLSSSMLSVRYGKGSMQAKKHE